MDMVVRKPAVAGMFYPAEREELLAMLDAMVPRERADDVPPVALVVPHAGYIYSGPFAGQGYAYWLSYRLEAKQTEPSVWVLAPSHFYPFYGVSVGPYTVWETPLGPVPVDVQRQQQLLRSAPHLVTDDPLPHVREHSLEVQLPFLQYVLGSFRLIPLSFGEVDVPAIAQLIMQFWQPGDLLVVSTDLSHYYPDPVARQLDQQTLEIALSGDWQGMLQREACGRVPWATGIYIAKEQNWHPKLIAYGTSADTAGDPDRVVGYATIGYWK